MKVAVHWEERVHPKIIEATHPNSEFVIEPDDDRWLQSRMAKLPEGTTVRLWVEPGPGPLLRFRLGKVEKRYTLVRGVIKSLLRLHAKAR